MAIYESLFGNDVALKTHTHFRALPAYKDNGWRPIQPHQWPDMSQCVFIAHDTENKELDFDNGPGWSRGQVQNVGHSLAAYWPDGTGVSLYLPICHEVDPHLNLPEDKVIRYVRDCLQTPHIPKGYANGIYDVGTSTEQAIYTQGTIHEIQFAEGLLTEDENVALDVLAKKYLGVGKESNDLYEWCAAAYGGNPTGTQRGNIYRASPMLVGPYAESDAALIRPILREQWARMDNQQLLDLYKMECKLVRLLVRMRMQGVRIDLPYVEKLSKKVNEDIVDKIAEFHAITGIHTSESCPTGDIAKAFDALGIAYRTTEKTKKPSITADDLKLVPHRIAKVSHELRQLSKLKSTFIEGTLLSKHKDEIIHGSFEPMRTEEGGARTGRFVSNNPNLQTIPIRTELGKMIRKAFIPFYGHACWQKDDYSQFEYRILAHFAVGPGSEELRQAYRNDPKTDYHDRTRAMILAKTGKDIPRKPTKTINFGLMNLMGEELLAFELSLPRKEVKGLLAAYHEGNPYIKATAKHYEAEAQQFGFVRTELGRYRRFEYWEPIPRWDDKLKQYTKYPAFPYWKAIQLYGSRIQRAKCHTALNSKTQGTNADGIKRGMVECDEAGIFDVTGVPTITLHDELDYSVIDDSPARREAHSDARRIMEGCLPSLSVPIRVDTGRGTDWGSIE